ncbi:hypothetical protein MBANPS3_012063 [Mucor bainieri]
MPIKGLNLLGLPLEKPRPLAIPESNSLTQDFRQVALNAMEAGFDGVEIYSANDYLLNQFLNTSSNKRTVIYGGSAENRCQLSLEVVDAVVDAIGADRTAIRFSPWSAIKTLTKRGDMPHKLFKKDTLTWPTSTSLSLALIFTDTLDPFRQIWKGPFISAGGYTYNTQSAFDVAEKTDNLIAFGRLFISNPDLPERLRHGHPLNKYDHSTFYTHDSVGYTDYPFFKPV